MNFVVAGLFELGHELRSAIDLDGLDLEGHVADDFVEEEGCRRRGGTVESLGDGPLGDRVVSGEVLVWRIAGPVARSRGGGNLIPAAAAGNDGATSALTSRQGEGSQWSTRGSSAFNPPACESEAIHGVAGCRARVWPSSLEACGGYVFLCANRTVGEISPLLFSHKLRSLDGDLFVGLSYGQSAVPDPFGDRYLACDEAVHKVRIWGDRAQYLKCFRLAFGSRHCCLRVARRPRDIALLRRLVRLSFQLIHSRLQLTLSDATPRDRQCNNDHDNGLHRSLPVKRQIVPDCQPLLKRGTRCQAGA
jgi:hypothetical protein